MGVDSKSEHVFIAEIEVSELYTHIYYTIYNVFENSVIIISKALNKGWISMYSVI